MPDQDSNLESRLTKQVLCKCAQNVRFDRFVRLLISVTYRF